MPYNYYSDNIFQHDIFLNEKFDTYTLACIPDKQICELANWFTKLKKKLDQNQLTLGIMLKIENAFDNATFSQLCMSAESHILEPTQS